MLREEREGIGVSGDQGRPPWSRGLAVGKCKAPRINSTSDLEIQSGCEEEGFLLCICCLNIQSTFSDQVLGRDSMTFLSVFWTEWCPATCLLSGIISACLPPFRSKTSTKLQLCNQVPYGQNSTQVFRQSPPIPHKFISIVIFHLIDNKWIPSDLCSCSFQILKRNC